MEVDFQLIKRYLDGNAKDGDKELILDSFSNFQAEGNLREQYHLYWSKFAHKLDSEGYDESVILGRIYHEMKLEESRSFHRKKTLSRIINYVSKVAAILTIPLIVFVYLNRENFMPTRSEIAYSEVYSPLGTRTMFYLPDGSKGCLNGGSFLKFPTEFKGKSREILLRGEAYFDVKSDPRKPFIVSGDNIEIVAYGTSFNVLAYPDDQFVKVTLVNGNIKVMGKQNDKILKFRTIKPDQMCIFDLSTSSCEIAQVDVSIITSWKEGKLIFRDDPLYEVIKKINRWYNVNIIIKDEILASYVYMATFEDETLEEVLKLLMLSAPIDYKVLNRERRKDGTFEKRKIELYYKP